MLGETIFTRQSSINTAKLYARDESKNDGILMSTYSGLGIIDVNTYYIGQKQQNSDHSTFNSIKNVFVHELGHALGLNHTYSIGQAWSWSNHTDIMAAEGSGLGGDQTVLTNQDIAAAKLVRHLHMFYNTADPLKYMYQAADRTVGSNGLGELIVTKVAD